MIAYFLLGLALLVGAILLLRWFIDAEPKQVVRTLGWTAAVLAVIAGLFLLFAGRHALGALLLPALLPLIWRWRQILGHLKSARGPSPGQTSKVETRVLEMTLEHDTGVMTGVVREGSYAGARLEDLSLDDLVALWRECRAVDAQSAAVLEAYLDRTQGADWRETAAGAGGGEAGAGGTAGGGEMTVDEAYAILGLQKGASAEEVRRAYRDLMQKLHPDHGGSNYIASKLNQAKRLLIGE